MPQLTTTTDNATSVDNATNDVNSKVDQALDIVNKLTPAWNNLLSNFRSLFGNNNVSNTERDAVIQQQIYSMQLEQQHKQQQTIIIAAVLCVVAIVITVLVTRKK